jgi:glutamate-1-semialdehyde 2,1-aminomutase
MVPQAGPVAGAGLPVADRIYARAARHLPGGNSRTTLFVPPRPPYAVRGHACWVDDADGNTVLDLLNNYTALIHGHARDEIVTEVAAALRDGTAFGLPTEHEVVLAERLSARIPAMQSWRFTNSGTEAVMMAIRLARAVTGRSKVLRFAGAYHGCYDAAMQPPAAGLPGSVADDIVTVPVGSVDGLRAAIHQHAETVACVLFDAMPNRAGLEPATHEFVDVLRDETRRHEIVLIQDEVISFRIAFGGMQELYGVQPDLTTVGKVIGGGFPVGAIGGSSDLMAHFDPRRSDSVAHPGTFSANPVTMRAGRVALELLTASEISRINDLGDVLRTTLSSRGWSVSGYGSLLQVRAKDLPTLWWRLYEEGILIGKNGLMCLSTAMGEEQVERAIDVFDEVKQT